MLLWSATTSSSGLPSCKGGLGPSTCQGMRGGVTEPPQGHPGPPLCPVGAYLDHLRWFLTVSHNLQACFATPLAVPDGSSQLLSPAALQDIAPGPTPDEESLGADRGTVVMELPHGGPQPTSPRLGMEQPLGLKLVQEDAMIGRGMDTPTTQHPYG